jgi:hypothetical protein
MKEGPQEESGGVKPVQLGADLIARDVGISPGLMSGSPFDGKMAGTAMLAGMRKAILIARRRASVLRRAASADPTFKKFERE